MLSPSEVLDCHIELKNRMGTPSFTALLTNSFTEDWYAANLTETSLESNAAHLTDRTKNAVGMAHLYRVTPDMVDLLLHAASELDDSDTFDLELPPTSHGLVHFAKPIPLKELRGDTMLAHWLLWFPMQVSHTYPDPITGKTVTRSRRTIMMVWWNDGYLQPDPVWERTIVDLVEASQTTHPDAPMSRAAIIDMLHGVIGRWNWIGGDFMGQGTPLGGLVRPVPQETLDHEREVNGQDTPLATETTNLARIAHTLWLMLNQTVTATADEPIERHAARRARRANLPARVTVVQLRRTKDATHYEGATAVERHHHWIVRGFWRWQAHGPGRTERRRIWVHSHMRGPLDKPLLHSEKLYSLER